MLVKNTNDIVWDSTGVKGHYRGSTVYKRHYGIRQCALDLVSFALKNYSAFKSNAMSTYQTQSFRLITYPSFMHALFFVTPRVKTVDLDLNKLRELVVETIEEALEEEDVIKEDALFLAYLANKGRPHNEQCAICLTNDIMGTTCGCGHTEIRVVRPCGHSFCNNPCYSKWVKFSSTELDLKCPMCRTVVEKSFAAELIRANFDMCVDKLVMYLDSKVVNF
jgi:hypothetical protein